MSSSFALYDQNVSLIQDSGRIVVTCAKSPTGICLVIDRKTAKISSQTAVQADVLKPGETKTVRNQKIEDRLHLFKYFPTKKIFFQKKIAVWNLS